MSKRSEAQRETKAEVEACIAAMLVFTYSVRLPDVSDADAGEYAENALHFILSKAKRARAHSRRKAEGRG